MSKINNKNKPTTVNKNLPVLKNELQTANEENALAENIINTMREPLLVLDQDLRVVKASRSFYDYFKVTPDETIGMLIYDLGNHQWDIPKLKELLETILPEKTTFDNYEIEHIFPAIGKRTMLLNARQIKRAFGKEKIILLAIEDITERKRAELGLSETNRMTNEYLDILFNHAHAPIIIWNTSFEITHINQAFEKLCGYNWSEVKEKRIDILFPKDKIESTLELINKTLQSNERPDIIEVDILTKNKGIKTVLWNPANIYDKEGNQIVATIAQDITERKNIEQKIRESEKRFRTIFDQAPIAIALLDKEGHTVISNLPLSQMTGYSSAELSKMKFTDFTYSEDIGKDMSQFTDLIEGKISRYSMEKRFVHKNGNLVWVNLFVTMLRYADGFSQEILGMAEDITERKQAEESLRESEERFRIITEDSADAIFIVDDKGKYLYVNNKAVQMLGYSKGEMLSFTIANISPKDKLEEHYQIFKHLQQEGSYFSEIELVKKDGTIIPTDFNAVVLPNGLIYASCRNITKRKSIESENILLAESLKTINECVSITDMEDKILFVNESFIKTYGYDEEELVGKNISMVRSLNNAPELVKKILSTTISGGWQGELWNRRKDGSEFQINLSTTVIRTKDNKSLGLIGVATDISERRRVEDALIISEKEFRNLAEAMPQIVWITRPDGWNIYFSQQWVDYTGLTLEESYGHGWNKPFHPDDQQQAWAAWQNATKNNGIYSIESRIRSADGVYNWFLVRGVPILDANGTIIKWFGTCTDINEIKRNEKELIDAKERAEQSDKLKSEFLSQMSHEIRTPINVMLGNIDYLAESLDANKDTDIRNCFESIDLASKRIIRTVDLVLNASELQTSDYKLQLVKVDLDSDILKKLYQEHLLSAKQKGIEITYVCKEKETIVIADQYSITQIFANLINNAIKYTEKGKVEILLEKNKTGNLTVEVKDTGIGISKEFLTKIFEPFAQEEQGYIRSYDGSGLGLTLVKKYCELNNAVIEVESEKNEGSVFRIIFSNENTEDEK